MEAPQSLIQYEPSVQIYETMRQYHQQKNQDNIVDSSVPPKEECNQHYYLEIIDCVLPPRDWTDHMNKLHIQYVSHQPASREDVIELEKTLDTMIDDRQARRQGICGIREELFSQTFDEIIRQIAIDSAERGLLLMRVRDQRKMTLAAYQTVFQSSVSYGMSKMIETQQQKSNQQEVFEELQAIHQQLQEKKYKLLCDKDLLQKQIRETREWEKQKRDQELKFLRLQQQNLTQFLQAVKTQSASTN